MEHASRPDPLAGGKRVRRTSQSVVCEEVDDELVVYMPVSSQAFSLNASARAIWELCGGTHTAREIADTLARRFGVEAEQLWPDVCDTVTRLRALGLLAGIDRPPTQAPDSLAERGTAQ